MPSPNSALGVIMLDTEFERPVGDVGHEQSWSMPVRFKRVPKASPERVIRSNDATMIDEFIAAGNALIDDGCSALITSCGFLAKHQKTLSNAFNVPFAASSLTQIPMIRAVLPQGQTVGVITYDQASLTADHFAACGTNEAIAVKGVPDGGVFRRLIEGDDAYDFEALKSEIVTTAMALKADNPSIGAILLECTNMPPFAQSISLALGLPVFDILSTGHWLYQSTRPRDFAALQQRAF